MDWEAIHFISKWWKILLVFCRDENLLSIPRFKLNVACVASVSVRLTSKERGTRNEERESKTARQMAQVKERGGGGGERKETLSFFGSRFISRSVKTENPLPRSFFAPKPNGNTCYAG